MTSTTDTAERCRTLRRHYRLTQTELATLLDVTRQTVTNWERGFPMSRVTYYALRWLDYQLSTDPVYRARYDVYLPPIELEHVS
jgi:transcriptional regulator with XRE-family HTH domain